MTIGVPWRRVAVVFATVAVVLVGRVRRRPRRRLRRRRRHRAPRHALVRRQRPRHRSCSPTGSRASCLAKVQLESDERAARGRAEPQRRRVLDRSANTPRARRSTPSALRVGSAQPLGLIAAARHRRRRRPGRGRRGSPGHDRGVLLPPEGEPLPVRPSAPRAPTTRPVSRPTAQCGPSPTGRSRASPPTGREVLETGLGTARFTLVGNTPLLLDAGRGPGAVRRRCVGSAPRRRARSSEIVRPTGRPARDVRLGRRQRPRSGASAPPASTSRSTSTGSTSTAATCSRSPVTPVRSCGPRPPRSCGSTGGPAGCSSRCRPTIAAPVDRPDADPVSTFAVASSVDLVWIEDVDGDGVGGQPVGHRSRSARPTRRRCSARPVT